MNLDNFVGWMAKKMKRSILPEVFCTILCTYILSVYITPTQSLIRDGCTGEMWGYQNIRDQAHMFWWLYTNKKNNYDDNNGNYNSDKSRPLLMWLQGGPGASSTGFGNMAEIGPLDEDLNTRYTLFYINCQLI